MSKIFLITGGAGFIGFAVIRELISNSNHRVISIDKLTAAGNLESLASVSNTHCYELIEADIADAETLDQIFTEYAPDVVKHLAVERHVDRFIDGPAEFIQTNMVGTYLLLEAARKNWENIKKSVPEKVNSFRFHHEYVTDRPGHDLRYAIDAGKIERELGWRPRESFESGLRKTVEWYLANEPWWQHVHDGSYRGERQGQSV